MVKDRIFAFIKLYRTGTGIYSELVRAFQRSTRGGDAAKLKVSSSKCFLQKARGTEGVNLSDKLPVPACHHNKKSNGIFKQKKSDVEDHWRCPQSK
jgi:hypothetical protein